jgi:hypothetical protein
VADSTAGERDRTPVRTTRAEVTHSEASGEPNTLPPPWKYRIVPVMFVSVTLAGVIRFSPGATALAFRTV